MSGTSTGGKNSRLSLSNIMIGLDTSPHKVLETRIGLMSMWDRTESSKSGLNDQYHGMMF
jgi:hypothetical protein